MVSFKAFTVLFMAALAASVAVPAPEAAGEALQKRQYSCGGQTLAPGQYACSGIQGVCTSCAIVTGNSAGQCVESSLCGNSDGTCTEENGSAFCT